MVAVEADGAASGVSEIETERPALLPLLHPIEKGMDIDDRNVSRGSRSADRRVVIAETLINGRDLRRRQHGFIGKPLPDEAVLTPTEIAAINQRLSDYNAAISAAAAARDIPVVDIHAFFNRVKQGQQGGPFSLNLGYATGGTISLDGYHLTDIGYTL